MHKAKQKRLEAAGWKIGDYADFLGLTDEERQLVELRINVSRTIRQLREKHKLTQAQLARKIRSSQSRIAKLEAGLNDISLDLLMRAMFALGGRLQDLLSARPSRPRSRRA
jgi:ribosome-binding protein aMBF1 (putative translation factor)